MTIYAVGDIHGHLDKLKGAIARIEDDGGPEARVIFLGDMIDRGPDSAGVIEHLRHGVATGRNWTVLLGNHDQMLLQFLDSGDIHHPRTKSPESHWLMDKIGGLTTLASYGIDVRGDRPVEDLRADALAHVPQGHRDFLASLPRYVVEGDLLFAHAGIEPGLPLDQQDPDTFCWIRDPFTRYSAPHPWLIVHGHVHLDAPTHFGNRIDLDGGAGYGRPLAAAALEGRDCWLLTDAGRQPLLPQ